MKNKFIFVILAVLVLSITLGLSWGKISLKVTEPLIDLNVLIKEASIGHVGENAGPENAELNDPDNPTITQTGGNTEGVSDVGLDDPDPEDIVSEFIIRINDRTIFINNTKCSDIDALDAAIRTNFSEGVSVTLEDDYAEYYSYIQTRNRLDEMGLKYNEIELD